MLTALLGPHSLPLRILCLGAHSDDIEIGCGGTVLRLLAERPGSSVYWVVFSAADERADEARRSAADFLSDATHSEVVLHHFRESYFPYEGAQIKDAFEDLKRSVSPDIILCHRRNDEHQDHRTIAQLVWNTFRNHLIAEYEIPKYEGDLGNPNFFVPLPSAVAARKVELLLEHFGTQRGRQWFRAETFDGLLSLRGVECAAPDGKAEAFHVRKIVVG